MKKKIALILCVLITAMSAGCSSGKTINAQQAVTNLTTEVSYGEVLNAVDYKIFLKRAGIDESIVTDATVYMGSAAVVDTIAVIGTTDTAAVENALKGYIESQKESYASYRPDEVPKLDDAVLRVQDEYVVLCISTDSNAANAAIDAAIN